MPRRRPTTRQAARVAGLVSALAAASGACQPEFTDGCDFDSLCPTQGVAEGFRPRYSIVSIDAFFAAVVDLRVAADRLDRDVRGELDAIAVSVGEGAGADPAAIAAAIDARIDAAVVGGLRIWRAPVRCEAAATLVAAAAVACDREFDLEWAAAVRCEGACDVAVDAQAECVQDGVLTCKGQAPELACAGDCRGTCALTEPATCDGVCRGTCEGGGCSAVDPLGRCAGACDGLCVGECELSVGGPCPGACEGECTYAPAGATCDAGVQPRCAANEHADIACAGACDGRATLPVSPECRAIVEAAATIGLACPPPAITITWQWRPELAGDAAAESSFRAWVNTLELHLARLAAANARAARLVDATLALADEAEGNVLSAIRKIQATGGLADSILAGCALMEIEPAGAHLTETAGALAGSVSASAEVLAARGG